MARYLIVLMVCCGFSGGGFAASVVSDPMRPPAVLGASVESDSTAATSPLLTSILLPKKGRASAIIGGQMVRVGDQVGESKVVRITGSEVVLKSATGLEHLSLTPDVQIVNRPLSKNNRHIDVRASSGSR